MLGLKCFYLMVLFGLVQATKQQLFFYVSNENGKIETKTPEQLPYYHQGDLSIVAYASLKNNIMDNGWAELQLETYANHENKWQAYSAGYLEGLLTKDLIQQHWNNTVQGYCEKPTKFCKKLYNFLTDNLNWMLKNIKDNPSDPYWQQIELTLFQVQGLEDAYYGKKFCDMSIRLQPFGLLLMEISGDLEDLEIAFNKKSYFVDHPIGSGSCSALVKLLVGNKDLLVSQDTWAPYQIMLRIMKKYTFNFNGYEKHVSAFSGYPGSIFSGDDYHILSSQLVTMETTNGNSNPELWKYVQPDTNLEWIRTIVANRLSTSGKTWVEVFSKFNSGTYNNQWMIIDYKKFEKGAKKLKLELLYILEQLPGHIKYSDETVTLEKNRYWSSYNIPYFPYIFNMSGQPAFVKKFGNWFTHDMNPRAQIFRRDQDKVKDIPSLIKLMRYNDFKNDPISRCNCTPPYSAEDTIAARSDLNLADGKYPFAALGQRQHGAIDVKATNSDMIKFFGIIAECGPTHDTQPVFKWSTSPYSNLSHIGHPDEFNFKPVLFSWN